MIKDIAERTLATMLECLLAFIITYKGISSVDWSVCMDVVTLSTLVALIKNILKYIPDGEKDNE